MHYKTPALSFDVDGVENFLSATGGKHIGKQEIELKKDEIENWPKVLPGLSVRILPESKIYFKVKYAS